jgi:hypothetical protein
VVGFHRHTSLELLRRHLKGNAGATAIDVVGDRGQWNGRIGLMVRISVSVGFAPVLASILTSADLWLKSQVERVRVNTAQAAWA